MLLEHVDLVLTRERALTKVGGGRKTTASNLVFSWAMRTFSVPWMIK